MSLNGMTEERLALDVQPEPKRRVLVDAHVHLYPSFDRAAFLRSAVTHAERAGVTLPWLLLTETSKDFAFRGLKNDPPAGWSVHAYADGRTLALANASDARVMVTAGRQVQTEEGLELLTVGSDDPTPDGTPLREAYVKARADGAVAIIPWGFGKWSGRRGRILADFLTGPNGSGIHLGDNGGRPWFWPTPGPFAAAGRNSRRVLPGSDPLPFASHQDRAGSYGMIVELSIDRYHPFDQLVSILSDHSLAVEQCGRRAGGIHFIRDQIAMQIVKRTRR